ncbi:MAG TPA: hypothetical protein VN408_22895 [Actinoplanes sp.]|nr:hypothetical protein [Actinoplanes sp.]
MPLQRRVAPISGTQANPNLDPAVENLTLAGDYGNAFFESYQYNNEFSAYLFNYWQYTDYYAAWHGMPTQGVPESMYDPSLDWREKWFEFGMLNLPNAAYTNAAHKNGVKSLGTVFLSEDDANQWKAYDRERRWWTGSSTGGTQDAGTWKGIKSYITERSAISGPVFDTTFNTGHGLEYVERGTPAGSREWSNINVQDHPVTWQWNHTGSLGIDYDYGSKATQPDRFGYQQIGAYQGGSSLVLTGDDYLKLYRTDLDVSAGSTLGITYRKVSAADSSQLKAAVTFADAPTTVVRLPITGSGVRSSGWTTATLDLGAYRNRRIATIGLVVAGSGITGYQLNIGRITVSDGRDHTPAKPSGFHLRAGLIGSGELELGWTLGSYDEVAEYAVYDGTEYLGGIYDDVLYVKRFTAPKGTLRLVAIGHDGSVSEPAELPYDFTRGPGNVTAVAATDGTLTVKWVTPARDFTLQNRRVPDGATEAVLTGQPVGGGHYLVTVTPADGTAVSYRGRYTDSVIEPYPASLVTISGNRFRFNTPPTADWYKLYVEENGVAKTFATTYSSGAKPYIIRGRTTSAALTVAMSSATSRVTVTIEDYAGNRATTVVRGTVSDLR